MVYGRDYANLWTLLTPPTVWALHFLFAYVAAAMACGETPFELGPVRVAIGVATALALGLIALAGRQAYRHWGMGADRPPHDAATDEDRQHFLGFATLLLCGLSAVAVVFSALPALFLSDCR